MKRQKKWRDLSLLVSEKYIYSLVRGSAKRQKIAQKELMGFPNKDWLFSTFDNKLQYSYAWTKERGHTEAFYSQKKHTRQA